MTCDSSHVTAVVATVGDARRIHTLSKLVKTLITVSVIDQTIVVWNGNASSVRFANETMIHAPNRSMNHRFGEGVISRVRTCSVVIFDDDHTVTPNAISTFWKRWAENDVSNKGILGFNHRGIYHGRYDVFKEKKNFILPPFIIDLSILKSYASEKYKSLRDYVDVHPAVSTKLKSSDVQVLSEHDVRYGAMRHHFASAHWVGYKSWTAEKNKISKVRSNAEE